MDKIKSITKNYSDFLNKIYSILVPYVVFIIILYIITQMFIAKIDYSTWIDWWNNNGGNNYSSSFDIMSMAYFSHSQLLFNLRQIIQPGTANLTYTEIMLLQTIIINNAKVVKSKKPILGQFVTPEHLCQGIAWTNNDIDIFREGIMYYYNNANVLWYKPWLNAGRPGPDDGYAWTRILSVIYGPTESNGFWPHQNNCDEFFDMPAGSTSTETYNLVDNTAKSIISGVGNKPEPLDYYSPGSNKGGSWAQLFADFGIVYTTKEATTTSAIPVLTADSNIDIWYNSGATTTNYGPNFMGLYKINPSSYLITSWVASMYNDPSTGQKLDPQAFKNLLGINPGALKEVKGGWVKFFKGINTNLYSYNEIMNNLFASYATNYKTIPPPPAGCSKKKAIGLALAVFIGIAAMAITVSTAGAGLAVVGVAAGAGVVAGLSAPGCPLG